MASILERYKKTKAPKAPQKTMEQYAEDALYREVWEDVNNEKTTAFLKKYARPLIAGALVILILITGIQLWRHQARSSRLAAAQAYETAIGNMDAGALANLAKNTSGATSDLAMFQSFMMTGDQSKLEALAANGSTRDFRDLALLHLAALKGDGMSAAEFEKYLAPLNTKNSPFYFSASLMIARKYLAANDRGNANIWLDKIISDKDAPNVINAGAQALR